MWVFRMGRGPLPQTHMSTPKPNQAQTAGNHTRQDAEARSDGTDSNKWIFWDNDSKWDSEHGGTFQFLSQNRLRRTLSSNTRSTSHRHTHTLLVKACTWFKAGNMEQQSYPRPQSMLRFPTVMAKNTGNVYHVCFCSVFRYLHSSCIK